MAQALRIHDSRAAIIEALRQHQTLVVVGDTGTGKTTQVPRFLYEAGFCRHGGIGVTEPRRVAAISVATWVAQGFGEPLGGLVGYQIRHDNRTSEFTVIKYMTEGILLRELLADPLLNKYDVLILDEVHERGVNQDLIMALVKDLLPQRPDLKVVIMSATIEEQRFASFFGAPIVRIEGRTYPIDIEYADPVGAEPTDAAADKVKELLARTPGDILVFVPDYDSIRRVIERLTINHAPATAYPLYGNQSPEEQMKVFERVGRSVIIATNVAETSVTLDGVTAVVDTGLIKEMRYYPGAAFSALKVVKHSRAGCDQRAGRAGRTAPGLCVRLYAKDDYLKRSAFTEPEIKRVSLDQVLLQLKSMGISDKRILRFGFLDPPSRESWNDAARTLRLLEATTDRGELTDTGRLMGEMPLPPVVTKMVLSAERFGCVDAIVKIAASFSTRPVFVRPIGHEPEADDAHMQFRDPRSDFLTLLNVLRAWHKVEAEDRPAFAEQSFLHSRALEEIDSTAKQITEMLVERGIRISQGRSPEDIGKAVVSGLIANLMRRTAGRSYETVRYNGVFVHPSSSVYNSRELPGWIVAAAVVETTRLYARDVQAVPSRWLKGLPTRTSDFPNRPRENEDNDSERSRGRHHRGAKRQRHGRRGRNGRR